MKAPIRVRQQIPFFHDKSAQEFQQDPYERFDPMVLRQSALHLADELWGQYPMQAIVDFTQPHLEASPLEQVVELGCSTGRWIAEVAQQFPTAICWGLDYSYQMLKRAQEVWVSGKDVSLNLSRYGFSATTLIKGQALKNLNFGLAKAEALPFAHQTQNLVLSSFLFDRLGDPVAGLKEIQRVLKPNGKMILISPLNFSQAQHWETFYPPIKIYSLLTNLGFEILDWQENLIIEEPLDHHGNTVQWNCIALVGEVK